MQRYCASIKRLNALLTVAYWGGGHCDQSCVTSRYQQLHRRLADDCTQTWQATDTATVDLPSCNVQRFRKRAGRYVGRYVGSAIRVITGCCSSTVKAAGLYCQPSVLAEFNPHWPNLTSVNRVIHSGYLLSNVSAN